ncbi:MAG: efflux transporter outer membrane subunit [Burkholderiales bacterium]|nr:efflux transporter outer membrane subunit [Burkholderiales bacterium]
MSRRCWLPAGASLLAAALLGACQGVGPDYVRPSVAVPDAYKNAGGSWKPAQPADVSARGPWWTLFKDPELNALAERVGPANQSIRQAEARYRQAQALVRQAQADRYPFLTAAATASRSRDFDSSAGARSSFELAADASWEADLWGRVRRSVEAGEAQARAAAAEIESVRLVAVAALVQSYLLIRVLDVQARLLEDTVAAYGRFLKLTSNRYNAGVVGKSDVVQAEAQLKSTQAQLVDLGVQRAQLEHAIAVLVGETPASLSIAPAPMVAAVPAIPTGLPSELLERRPDIAVAERNVAAANARIGVAQAAFYPSVTLSAAAGLRSAMLPELLRTPNLFWALGTAAAQVLFDGGARRAVADQARAVHEAEVALYRQTVLTAFQEVEDNLAALRLLAEGARLQADAVAAARQSVQLAENRYKAGTASALEVITLQAIALSNERSAVGTLGRQLSAAVQLVRALGGGWGAVP